jgi:hypothetical protein
MSDDKRGRRSVYLKGKNTPLQAGDEVIRGWPRDQLVYGWTRASCMPSSAPSVIGAPLRLGTAAVAAVHAAAALW